MVLETSKQQREMVIIEAKAIGSYEVVCSYIDMHVLLCTILPFTQGNPG